MTTIHRKTESGWIFIGDDISAAEPTDKVLDGHPSDEWQLEMAPSVKELILQESAMEIVAESLPWPRGGFATKAEADEWEVQREQMLADLIEAAE